MDHNIKPVNVELIAKTCHEVNRAFSIAFGDHSHKPWEFAPDWQRESIIKGVEAHLAAGPEGLSPGASHLSWLEEKRAAGWKYGPVKDEVKKEHPCYVPFGDLPAEQQAKDYLFGAVVRAMRDKT